MKDDKIYYSVGALLYCPANNESIVRSITKEKFGKRVFATPKKQGAETAEANLNAGLAAANQIVGFFKDGCTRFQVNKF